MSAAIPDTNRGSAVYFTFVLRFIYDFLVLRLYCSYVWRCPARRLGALYSTQLDKQQRLKSERGGQEPLRLLDIGVGTGYHLSHAPLPARSEVVLADLNTNCLEAASARTRRAHPRVSVSALRADFLEPSEDAELALSPRRLRRRRRSSSPDDDDDDDVVRFDVVSCCLLLHCLPGPPHRKVEGLARLGLRMLREDGVLLGATILGPGADHTILGRFIMFWHNRIGVFDNAQDDAQVFARGLEAAFGKVEWQVVGAVFLFAVQYPKQRNN